MVAQREAPSWWCEGCWIPLRQPNQLGRERGSGQNNDEYHAWRLLGHCGYHHREEDQGWGARMPWGKTKTSQTSTAAHNIKEWMQGLEEDASEVKLKNYKMNNHGTEWKNAHPKHLGRNRRWHGRQGAPWLLRHFWQISPLQVGEFRLGRWAEFPPINHDLRIWRE